ncbi:hypothetical protein [Thalassobius sp. MITS945101]|uniref:hypothetical protein n=1 Tax=Thalassobius sp. MITS945101 TaxID=3096994 RepID=UPI00399977DA
MANQLELAQNRLFGADGLGVSDFKMYPGTSREVSKAQFAEQINKVLAQVEAGDYELVEEYED